jgi:hypothetical protein
MPRYFFHFRDGELLFDNEGTELSGLEEARTQAVVASGEMLRDHGAKFWSDRDWHMWVTDDLGATVCALKFSAG